MAETVPKMLLLLVTLRLTLTCINLRISPSCFQLLLTFLLFLTSSGRFYSLTVMALFKL